MIVFRVGMYSFCFCLIKKKELQGFRIWKSQKSLIEVVVKPMLIAVTRFHNGFLKAKWVFCAARRYS